MKTIKRVYLIASRDCPACINAIASLGVENNKLKLNENTMLHVVYPKDRPEYAKKFIFETTPSFAFMSVQDDNGNNILEGVEETHIKTYQGYLGLKGLNEILEQIELGNVLETIFK